MFQISQSSYWQKATIGLDNGLVSKRRQTIVWTNEGLVYWRITQWLHKFMIVIVSLITLIIKPLKSKYSTIPDNDFAPSYGDTL